MIQNNHLQIRSLILILLALGSSIGVMPAARAEPAGPAPTSRYTPDWASLRQYPAAQWLEDAKFGIYACWGLFSVPAHFSDGKDGPPWAEWYGHRMYRDGETRRWHTEHYGPPEKFGYKDFIPRFTAEKFNADVWAEVFRRSGARFAGPTAIFCEGFAMWDSQATPWNAQQMGPRRDTTGELAAAIRKQGLKFIVTNHQVDGLRYFPKEAPGMDCTKPEYALFYNNLPAEEFWKQWEKLALELVDKYEPDQLWFDNGFGGVPVEMQQRLTAHYYNQSLRWGREVAIVHKHKMPEGVGVVDLESHVMHKKTPYLWQIDVPLDKWSWGYYTNRGGLHTRTVPELVAMLADVVSKNGLFLLCIQPQGDGALAPPQVEALLGLGRWLAVYGEAIYGTRPWRVAEEGAETRGTGKEIKFTRKDNRLYAICLNGLPGPLTLKTLAVGSPWCPEDIVGVQHLGGEGDIRWDRKADGLHVMPGRRSPSTEATVLCIELQGRLCSDLEVAQIGEPGGTLRSGRAWCPEGDGRDIEAKALVANYTDQPWTPSCTLLVDGKPVDQKTLRLPPRKAMTVQFAHRLGEAGVHRLAIHADAMKSAEIPVIMDRIPLAGTWRFQEGDRPDWAKPDFDDSAWRQVKVPYAWGHAKAPYQDPSQCGWFRRTIELPAEVRGHGVRLNLGNLMDKARVFVNGHHVGESGWGAGAILQDFDVPAGYLSADGRNLIAVRLKGNPKHGAALLRNMGFVEFLAK